VVPSTPHSLRFENYNSQFLTRVPLKKIVPLKKAPPFPRPR
jgi:hypothetical protein